MLRRSTPSGWIAAAADLLQPLYDLMCDRVRASRVIHTDDTGIKMLAPGSCRNAKFWTDIGDAAILLSVIASAKHCGVEPWSWLTAVLKEFPLRRANSRGQPPDLTDLLLDNWLQSHPQHHWQIDELRQQERTRSRQAKLSKRKR